MNKLFILVLTGLISSTGFAENKAADQLVASKKKADISYRQLMEVLGTATTLIHQGIIRENKLMVKQGADMILHHPAPRHKPWTIMQKADQESFKLSLLSFDKILDQHASKAAKEADKENWLETNQAAHELSVSCISCHSMWKQKVK